jgi:hypothetical protein
MGKEVHRNTRGNTMSEKPIAISNLSGGPIDLSEWQKGNKRLAVLAADWLVQRTGNNVAISTTHDGVLIIDFVLRGIMQPSVKVYDGKIIWPRGTDFELMMAFLQQE